ncbi:hypothetical protein CTAYLR_002456 [Chrysophaeum taylorii]|uniref:phenylalanine--tRNA ligase n=1 Tax=Chrysophaeum taylorii TaxID=2483200 RepID=A0AAD7XPK2_9STRA|nr:hypothetical protein CTAYLR_002456 [Chrysophaeum taylorii]
MPTVRLDRDDLFERLEKSFTQEEFELLCFEFGVELDDVTSEAETAREMGAKADVVASLSDRVIYCIDVPANRYDILCMEGMARALRIFQGLEAAPEFKREASSRTTMRVESGSCDKIRPFVACAVLRNVSFEDERVYKSFIDLQDKLHQNVCRRRTLVAIGTHDLNALRPPFAYRALAPETIKFVPLTEEDKTFDAKTLMDHYRSDPACRHLKPYTNIIYESPVYPVITDATGLVLSLPPIINGRASRIQAHTKDVFIECTGTDETKTNLVCDTVVAMFSEYCSFRVEPVDVVYSDGDRRVVTPLLSTRECSVTLDEIRKTIGLSESALSPDAACALLERMQLSPARYDAASDLVTVGVPCTRSDVMHAVDVIEDVAIAYGYNNVPEALPTTLHVGTPTPQNLFCDLLRDEISRAGYVEILTHGLCRPEENYTKLRLPTPETQEAVLLANPQSEEFEQCRTTLLVGALKTLQHNKSQAVKGGLKLFEVSDVVFKDDTRDVGARNERRLVATHTGATAGFEVIHGLLDRVMTCAQIKPSRAYAGDSLTKDDIAYFVDKFPDLEYAIEPADIPTFFPGRSALVVLYDRAKERAGEPRKTVVGKLGVLHPIVLANFEIDFPTSALELLVDPLRSSSPSPSSA